MSVLPFHYSEEKNSFMDVCCKRFTDYWLENPALMLVVWLVIMWIMAILISYNGDRVNGFNDYNGSNGLSE